MTGGDEVRSWLSVVGRVFRATPQRPTTNQERRTTMHYTEDDLSAYVTDPTSIPERDQMESHLADCPQCHASVVSLEALETDLRNPAVWQQADGFKARTARVQEAMRLK